MIKGAFAVSIAVVLGLATLPGVVSAKGFGWHTPHTVGPTFFTRSAFRHHNSAFAHSSYGGLVAEYPLGGYIESESEAVLPVQVGALIAPPSTLSCSHSRETVVVRSEEGGTRQITITRC